MHHDATTALRTLPLRPRSRSAKDKSKTATKATYNAKKDVATGTAKVKGHFGLAGTGKVKFTLKKGTKTVKSVTATLKKGAAKAAFKNVKAKGSYSITAAFSRRRRAQGLLGQGELQGQVTRR